MFMLMEGANRRGCARVGLLGIRGDNQKVKLSELIARLAEMLEEHGDIPVVIDHHWDEEHMIEGVKLGSPEVEKRVVLW